MNPRPEDEPVDEPPVVTRAPIAGALRGAGRGEPLTVGSLVRAIGGVLGIVESVLPSVVFLVVFSVTGALPPSVVAPVVLCAGFVLWRIVRRQTLLSATGGALGVGLSAVLALVTHTGSNFFVTGLITNLVYGVAFLVSLLVRRPLIGVLVSFLMNDRATWRADPAKRRAFTWLTLLWTALFAVRLMIEVPLWSSSATVALGVWRLVLGVPLFAPVLVLSILAVQAVYRRADPGALP